MTWPKYAIQIPEFSKCASIKIKIRISAISRIVRQPSNKLKRIQMEINQDKGTSQVEEQKLVASSKHIALEEASE